MDNDLWEKNSCPFCGREHDKLQELFHNTEKTLKENNKHIKRIVWFNVDMKLDFKLNVSLQISS